MLNGFMVKWFGGLRFGKSSIEFILQKSATPEMLNRINKAGYIKKIFAVSLLFLSLNAVAQVPDSVYKTNINTVRFHPYGDQYSLPVLLVKSGDQLELHFDDMDADFKNYYYTFQLCDYNWKPTSINPFDYIKGFTQQRINTYRYSSIALTRYTHYSAMLPDKNTTITRSGNFLLKVFLDGDTSKLVFTRRLLVLDQKAAISGKVIQPFQPHQYKTHQRIQFTANITGLNAFSAAQQVKVVVLQNNRWDNAVKDVLPSFNRGNVLDYSMDNNLVFAAGKEWRWLDLRSLRLQSDRIKNGEYKKTSTTLYMLPDIDRSGVKYVYYRDFNGMYSIETYETINPYWQGDYATVHFYFKPPAEKEYEGKDLYLAGQLTNYEQNEKYKMVFNNESKMYEGSLFLKQGYYNYTYLLADRANPTQKAELEGNYWETENSYTILLYYRSFTDRADQLIGVGKISTRIDRPGISF